MIGQQHLQSQVRRLAENRTLPRFMILVGQRGSGRKTFAKEIVSIVNEYRVSSDKAIAYTLPDVKIDTIRETIKQAYKNVTTVFYIIPDADTMSLAAKNALLKVTEEPPNESYFIMTLEDENNTLETIRSRGTVFRMDSYTPDEIFQYYWTVGDMPNDAEIVQRICATPGEVNICKNMCEGTIQPFLDYVELVIDNIAEVSIANSFKIASKVAVKEDDEGYDLKLFWRAFISVCSERAFTGSLKLQEIFAYGQATGITSKYLQQLRVKGINRQMLVDTWIMEVRNAWS